MFWYDHNLSGWGWFAMSASMILFWGVIITLGVLFVRALTRTSNTGTTADTPSAHTPSTDPEELLAERFARGEIDEDEYHRRLTVLRGRTGDGPRLSKS
ncbi:SHOCT domain-containing protein [Streptomyces sp. E11-3]|uniref:SHOCT domain-containing protein n=1 Tax=Streptomyces sp. E11-3 TaxID=3110112 RepID=UPI00397FA810